MHLWLLLEALPPIAESCSSTPKDRDHETEGAERFGKAIAGR